MAKATDVRGFGYAWGYDLQINDELFQTAMGNDAEIQTVPPEPDRLQLETGAEDFVEEAGQRYSRSLLSGGAGLRLLHSPVQEGRETRFWDSKGLDVFSDAIGDEYEVGLLHDTDTIASYGSNSNAMLAKAGDDLYWVAGAGIYDSSGTLKTTVAANAAGFEGLGPFLYTNVPGSGLWKHEPGPWTAERMSDQPYDYIWAAKGRILGAKDEELYEIVGPKDDDFVFLAGPDNLLDSLPPGSTWVDVVDAGPVILASGTDGTVRAFAESDGALTIAGRSEFRGEIVTKMAYTTGAIYVATAEDVASGGVQARVYRGAVVESNGLWSIADSQLLLELEPTEAGPTPQDRTLTASVTTRDSVYFGGMYDATTVQTWRFYLPTNGYARDLEFAAASINDLDVYDDEIYMAAGNLIAHETEGIYVTSGYFIGPLADFFTVEEKQWVRARFEVGAMPAGAVAELYQTTNPDDLDSPVGGWALVTRVSAGEGPGDVDLFEEESRWHAGLVWLFSDAGHTQTPKFRSYRFRAFPRPQRETYYRIPVNVSDQWEAPRRKRRRIIGRGNDEYARLKRFDGRSVRVLLHSPKVQLNALVERVEGVIRLRSPRGSWTEVAHIVVRGQEIDKLLAPTVVTAQGYPMGVGNMGIQAMGV